MKLFDNSDIPDEVVAASRGDQQAWESMYRRLYPKLRAFMARRMDVVHVDDAVSETMVRAVAGIAGYEPGPTGFDGWVFGIARRVAADHHRNVFRLRRQDTAAAGLSSAPDISGIPGDTVMAADEVSELRRAFDELTPSDQEILELRVVAGLSSDQVAAVLDKAPGAVRTAQSRALSRLRRIMEAESA